VGVSYGSRLRTLKLISQKGNKKGSARQILSCTAWQSLSANGLAMD
jgi:hypothetical protein